VRFNTGIPLTFILPHDLR